MLNINYLSYGLFPGGPPSPPAGCSGGSHSIPTPSRPLGRFTFVAATILALSTSVTGDRTIGKQNSLSEHAELIILVWT